MIATELEKVLRRLRGHKIMDTKVTTVGYGLVKEILIVTDRQEVRINPDMGHASGDDTLCLRASVRDRKRYSSI